MNEAELARWIADHPQPPCDEPLRRAAAEGYPIASAYLQALARELAATDLQLAPTPEVDSMPFPLFQRVYATELRSAPTLYAFAVRDRVADACAKLLPKAAPGTSLSVSPVFRVSQRARGKQTEGPFTAVLVMIAHPAAPEQLCVVVGAEQ